MTLERHHCLKSHFRGPAAADLSPVAAHLLALELHEPAQGTDLGAWSITIHDGTDAQGELVFELKSTDVVPFEEGIAHLRTKLDTTSGLFVAIVAPADSPLEVTLVYKPNEDALAQHANERRIKFGNAKREASDRAEAIAAYFLRNGAKR